MHWKELAKGTVNRSGIHYLEEIEIKHQRAGLDFNLQKIAAIQYEDLLCSWLSIPSVKTVLLFQQQIRNGEIPESK